MRILRYIGRDIDRFLGERVVRVNSDIRRFLGKIWGRGFWRKFESG